MRLLQLDESNPITQTKNAVLIKDTSAHLDQMQEAYFKHISSDFIIITLDYETPKKSSASYIKDKLKYLDRVLKKFGVENLLVADANYFKVMTKVRKTTPCFGYNYESTAENFEGYNCVLSINYQQLFYDPKLQFKLDLSLECFNNVITGTDIEIGSNIIHKSKYLYDPEDIGEVLNELHQYDVLTCDIETSGLELGSYITSIGFAWNKHEGIAFMTDQLYNHNFKPVYILLKNFFKNYKGTLIFHNGNFDIKQLIFELFMKSPLDNKGAIEGLEVFYPKVHDTKLIAYLATNSTTGNNLSLKELAHGFAGNYAVDVTDVSAIPADDLLKYNLIDCLATWYVYEKYFNVMVQDNQLGIYENIFLPSMKVITHMELTGMPMDMDQVGWLNLQLTADIKDINLTLSRNKYVKEYEAWLRVKVMTETNAKLKVKKHPIEHFDNVTYNPNSTTQTAELLHEVIKLPVIDLTDKGAPSVGVKSINKLLNKTDDPDVIEIIENLKNLANARIMKSTFVENFISKGIKKEDNNTYLHGNFNLGGTVSGRLSSNSPNLQNIPSSNKDNPYTKPIKKCFRAPKGWLFVGCDYNALEATVDALVTKDPNKLKIYTDGFDSHCLAAYYYFQDQMPDIDVNSVASINSIKTKYKDLRQRGKTISFAAQYGGTYHTFMDSGFSEEEAKIIEERYHDLYKVSDAWKQEKLKLAEKNGYVTGAFGLRVRTPILSQTIGGKKSTPYEAASESRTAGNALTQSYGMLNNKSTNDFMEKVYQSPYRHDILPVASIHDASYFLIRNNYGCVKWVNDTLIQCIKDHNLPELQHTSIELGGELSIFHPHWGNETVLPNNISKKEIRRIFNESLQQMQKGETTD